VGSLCRGGASVFFEGAVLTSWKSGLLARSFFGGLGRREALRVGMVLRVQYN